MTGADLRMRETTIRMPGGIPTTTTIQSTDRFPVRRGGPRDIDIVSTPQWSEVWNS